MDKEEFIRKLHTRDCSDYNRQKISENMHQTQQVFNTKKNFLPNPTNLNEDEEELSNLNACARTIYVDKMNGSSFNKSHRFETHNKREYSPK